ncbi:MAG: ribosome small subunit-dependent GTPase A, partial [Pirellulales bacterium]|nr:ribosome small subunit-dependent GTPase A [Pirellulales bacterium]
MAAKKRKLRADFRKNREVRAREKHRVERLAHDDSSGADAPRDERVSGKGAITRKRTVAGAEVVEDAAGTMVLPEIDRSVCRLGRVLRVQGLVSVVRVESGEEYACATRRLLKTLATDQRHVVAAGDAVWFRPEGTREGMIERVEPRRGVVSRTSRGRQHVLVTNVDQLVIVTSAAEPRIKPNLIDRMFVTAEKAGIRPILCINKIDLVEAADMMPLVGVWAQLGYEVLLTSVVTGVGVDRLRARLAGEQSVFSGQSGVGKSSLLNAVEPGLGLRVQTVSEETQKGRHTTTTAEMIPLSIGGYVVDTPGIRQFQLWDV